MVYAVGGVNQPSLLITYMLFDRDVLTYLLYLPTVFLVCFAHYLGSDLILHDPGSLPFDSFHKTIQKGDLVVVEKKSKVKLPGVMEN